MKPFEKIVLAIILALAAWAIIEAALLLRDSRREIPRIDAAVADIRNIQTDTTRTEAELAGLLNTTRQIAIAERTSEVQQVADVHKLAVDAGTTLLAADEAFQSLGTAARSLGTVGPQIVKDTDTLTADTHTALVSATRALEATNADLSNVNISQTLDALAETARHTATTTGNLADASQDVKDYIHRETTPVRGTWNAINAVLDFVWKTRGAVGF